MDITWLGHACFRLHSDDLVVLTDPYPLSLGLRPETRPATVVTVSNPHPNHSCWQEVAGEPKVFTAPGEYEYSGVSVRGVMTPLPPEAPQEQRNVAYTIELDGVSICHLGDIAAPLTTRQVDELGPVDVLFGSYRGWLHSGFGPGAPDNAGLGAKDSHTDAPRQSRSGAVPSGCGCFFAADGVERGTAPAPVGRDKLQPSGRHEGGAAGGSCQGSMRLVRGSVINLLHVTD